MADDNQEQKTKEWYNHNKSLSDKDRLFDKRIWRIRDVATFLNCSIGHVYNLASNDKIPCIKRGKFLYFIPQEVWNWMMGGKRNKYRKKIFMQQNIENRIS